MVNAPLANNQRQAKGGGKWAWKRQKPLENAKLWDFPGRAAGRCKGVLKVLASHTNASKHATSYFTAQLTHTTGIQVCAWLSLYV